MGTQLFSEPRRCESAIGFEGAFESDTHVYLVMDVVNGGDLSDVLHVCCTPSLHSKSRWHVRCVFCGDAAASVAHGAVQLSTNLHCSEMLPCTSCSAVWNSTTRVVASLP